MQSFKMLQIFGAKSSAGSLSITQSSSSEPVCSFALTPLRYCATIVLAHSELLFGVKWHSVALRPGFPTFLHRLNGGREGGDTL